MGPDTGNGGAGAISLKTLPPTRVLLASRRKNLRIVVSCASGSIDFVGRRVSRSKALYDSRTELAVGYTASSWVNFAIAVAGVAGALVGLLFVAVSIRAREVSSSRSLRSRAAQTLVLFMTSVVAALTLVAPQSDIALELELLGWATLSGVLFLVLDRRGAFPRRAWRATSSDSRRWPRRQCFLGSQARLFSPGTAEVFIGCSQSSPEAFLVGWSMRGYFSSPKARGSTCSILMRRHDSSGTISTSA
jgi:hypothetical protein